MVGVAGAGVVQGKAGRKIAGEARASAEFVGFVVAPPVGLVTVTAP
jgi:hypothetical protein